MYYSEDKDQVVLAEFLMPFAGKLDPQNRWVRLASIMPWDKIEGIYLRTMSTETGRKAISARIAFGAIYIKESENLTDEGCVTAIRENPYMQYFLGLHEFQQEPLFDASMMVHFRKRFPVEDVAKINEYVCTGKWPEASRSVDRNAEKTTDQEEEKDDNHDDQNGQPPKGPGSGKPVRGKVNPNTSKKKRARKKNRGKLIMDATVAPSDIKYPTDIDLLNQCREHLETAIDIMWAAVPHKGHKLPYSAKKARKAYLNISKSKCWTAKKLRKGIVEQLRFIEQAQKRFSQLMSLVPDAKFPRYLQDRLQVIPSVYAQQKEMYDHRTHICKDRIVSLE